jgi:hypothetical protein
MFGRLHSPTPWCPPPIRTPTPLRPQRFGSAPPHGLGGGADTPWVPAAVDCANASPCGSAWRLTWTGPWCDRLRHMRPGSPCITPSLPPLPSPSLPPLPPDVGRPQRRHAREPSEVQQAVDHRVRARLAAHLLHRPLAAPVPGAGGTPPPEVAALRRWAPRASARAGAQATRPARPPRPAGRGAAAHARRPCLFRGHRDLHQRRAAAPRSMPRSGPCVTAAPIRCTHPLHPAPPAGQPLEAWERHLDEGWDRSRAAKVAARFADLEMQVSAAPARARPAQPGRDAAPRAAPPAPRRWTLSSGRTRRATSCAARAPSARWARCAPRCATRASTRSSSTAAARTWTSCPAGRARARRWHSCSRRWVQEGRGALEEDTRKRRPPSPPHLAVRRPFPLPPAPPRPALFAAGGVMWRHATRGRAGCRRQRQRRGAV